MFKVTNKPTETAMVSANSWDYQTLMDTIDSLPNGLNWIYLTGPASKIITDGTITIWSTCVIFKRNDTLINCVIIPSDTQYPMAHFRKNDNTDGWGAITYLYGSNNQNEGGG